MTNVRAYEKIGEWLSKYFGRKKWILTILVTGCLCWWLFDGWAFSLYFLARLFGRGMVPALCGQLGSSDKFTLLIAKTELARIGAPAVPDVAAALVSGPPNKRAEAAETLYRVTLCNRNDRAKIRAMCTPNLMAALQDKDLLVRVWAARADWVINENVDRVLPVFLEAISCEDINISYVGFSGIMEMGSLAKDALPTIRLELDNKNPDIRLWANDALDELTRQQDQE